MGFLDKLGLGGNKAQAGDAAADNSAGGAEVQPNQSPDFLTNATQVAPAGSEPQLPAQPSADLGQAAQEAPAPVPSTDQVAPESASVASGAPGLDAGVDSVADQVSQQLGSTGESVKMPEINEVAPLTSSEAPPADDAGSAGAPEIAGDDSNPVA